MTVPEAEQFITEELSKATRDKLVEIREAASEGLVPFSGVSPCLAERLQGPLYSGELSSSYLDLCSSSEWAARDDDVLRQQRLVALIDKHLEAT